MGAVGGIFAAIFGVIWMIGAARIGAPGFFVAFGVVFVLMALCGVFFNLVNATSENRYSSFDLTEPGEEIDPLNEVFGKEDGEYRIATGEESAEDRLVELKSLRNKGLISEEEYKEQRERILRDV